jgi:hypothetical protein
MVMAGNKKPGGLRPRAVDTSCDGFMYSRKGCPGQGNAAVCGLPQMKALPGPLPSQLP